MKNLGEIIEVEICPEMTHCICGGSPRLVRREESFVRVWRGECSKCGFTTGVSLKKIQAAVKWEKVTMKHDNQWVTGRIMEAMKNASEDMQEKVVKIADGKDLRDLENETLRRVFDMVVSANVR